MLPEPRWTPKGKEAELSFLWNFVLSFPFVGNISHERNIIDGSLDSTLAHRSSDSHHHSLSPSLALSDGCHIED
jgi:hypothetical protein